MKNIVKFLYEVGSLRKIKRTWCEFFTDDLSNNAEHTNRVQWIAISLTSKEAEKHQVNLNQVIKLALVHEIGEIRSIDLNAITRRYATRNELKAVKDTFSDLPFGEDFINLWKETEEKNTIESKIVKDADYLDFVLEVKEKETEGNKLSTEFLKIFPKTLRTKFYTESAKQMFDEILNTMSYEWHLNEDLVIRKDWAKNEDDK